MIKNLFLLFLIFYCCGVTGFSQNFAKIELNYEYEVTMYSFTKKVKDSYCYSAVGGTQIKLVPKTIDSGIRYKMRKDFQKNHSKENAIKVLDSYVYVRKNDWVVIIEHKLSNSYCKDQKKREMFRFKKGTKLTDELIDEKVKSSVTYLWNKDDNYRGYKVLQKFQPYNNETNETSVFDMVKGLILGEMSSEEKSKFLKKYNTACQVHFLFPLDYYL